MFITRHRNFFFIATGLVLTASIAAIAFLGLPLSIDFKGGSLVEVTYTAERPEVAAIKENVEQLALGEISLRESGENGLILRTRTLTPAEHEAVIGALSENGALPLTEDRFNSIGPSLGAELGIKALYALAAVILAITLYIAWAFRRVSRPVSSWVYGIIVVVMLVHDVLVPTGVFAVLAYFTGAQVDALFVVALLAILGYSVNDTIIIFDRVREHLHDNEEHHVVEDFELTVGKAVTETLGRSINTSVTVALALIALIIVGSAATLNFAIILLAGVIAGTYSSILVAAPLLIPIAKRVLAREAQKKK